ncbi:MAG: hypothetical protein R3B68_14755 [Phycisphaerales bacterium]
MNRCVFRCVIAGVVPLALCGLAAAQPSALVVTNLTDPTTGAPVAAIEPGQTLRMRTRVSWQGGGQMAGITGDMLVVPLTAGGGEGVSTNRYSDYFEGTLVNLGTFSGDDLLGIDIAVVPWVFTGGFIVPPSGNSNGIDFIGFDWTAPAARRASTSSGSRRPRSRPTSASTPLQPSVPRSSRSRRPTSRRR